MAFVQIKDCLTSPRQLVRLILLVICVCITIYQLSGSITKMLNPPITSYYKFKYNNTIRYPAVTICRRPSFKRVFFPRFGVKDYTVELSAKDAFKEFRFADFTISEFIKNTTYSLEELIPVYGFKGLGNSAGLEFQTRVYPDRGLCHVMIPKEPVEAFTIDRGYFLYLAHTVTDKLKDNNGLSTSGFEIHIHGENDAKDEMKMATNFIYLETSEDMYVRLNVQTYSQISTSQQQCNSEMGYSKSQCEEKCLHNSIAALAGCSVPWLRHLEGNYTECTNSSAINIISVYFNEFSVKPRQKLMMHCNCPIACNDTIYTYQIESRRDADSIQAPSSTVTIYFASNLLTELSEVINYDWNIFLSDVGGSLGFLLGLSVIGTVTIFEACLRLVFFKSDGAEESSVEEEKLPHLSQGGKTEGESLKSVMEFMANCDMYQHMQEKKMEEAEDMKY